MGVSLPSPLILAGVIAASSVSAGVASATEPCLCPEQILNWNLGQPADDIPTNAEIRLWSMYDFDVHSLSEVGGAEVDIERSQASDEDELPHHVIVVPQETLAPETTYELQVSVYNAPEPVDALTFTTGRGAVEEGVEVIGWEALTPQRSLCYDWDGAYIISRPVDADLRGYVVRAEITGDEGQRVSFMPACGVSGESCDTVGAYLGWQLDGAIRPQREQCLTSDPDAHRGDDSTAIFSVIGLTGYESPRSEAVTVAYARTDGYVGCGCASEPGSRGDGEAVALIMGLLGLVGFRRR